jgi:deazaflavin-dependent oxidoreductase (nitroreductase family)
MSPEKPYFLEPSRIESFSNRLFGFLVDCGFGLSHNYLLQTRGRKTGRIYSTPVNLLEFQRKRFLVAARGYTQWVKNAEIAGEVTLKKGRKRQRFKLSAVPDSEKPEVLAAYLLRFKLTVQRYFPIPAGSQPEAFAPLAARYPVFELRAAG